MKDLRAILRWWQEQYDYRYVNPVRKFHNALSVIYEIPEKNRKISMEETILFLNSFKKDCLYHDVARIQFFCAGRIGEIVGIQLKNIDLKERVLLLKEVITLVNGKPKVKNLPKNGKARQVYINDTMLEIFKRRIAAAPEDLSFFFMIRDH